MCACLRVYFFYMLTSAIQWQSDGPVSPHEKVNTWHLENFAALGLRGGRQVTFFHVTLPEVMSPDGNPSGLPSSRGARAESPCESPSALLAGGACRNFDGAVRALVLGASDPQHIMLQVCEAAWRRRKYGWSRCRCMAKRKSFKRMEDEHLHID